MREDWEEEIDRSQFKQYTFPQGLIDRIPYGSEGMDWGAESGRECHDCKVKPGQFHVPGCDVESCPACGGQAISCPCGDETEQ